MPTQSGHKSIDSGSAEAKAHRHIRRRSDQETFGKQVIAKLSLCALWRFLTATTFRSCCHDAFAALDKENCSTCQRDALTSQ